MLSQTLDKSAAMFVLNFSRFEFALKRFGYATNRGEREDADVDWERFAAQHALHFEEMRAEDQDLAAAVQFLQDDPPRKLVYVEHGGRRDLFWKRAGPRGADLPELLVLVRRVRNNLFHGEKPETLVGGDNARGSELVRHSLVIIESCLTMDEQLRTIHHDYAHRPVQRID